MSSLRRVLVTGGTGSFGKAFVSFALKDPDIDRIVVFSRDEVKQSEMQSDPAFSNDARLRFFIGDVRDQDRLQLAMSGIDTVVHAAAMKMVPTAEYNPFECIHTNVLGAENIVRAALRNDVRSLVALSTDKAASPINLYGASKLASDKIFIAANNLSGGSGCRFSVVRYGNVIGSRGSVVPLFKRLVAEGADHIPITDRRMTRFWITLAQGVQFVWNSLSRMQGGEIFVPKIPSMKVVDVAEALAPNIPIRDIGIRPGEKLHEVMITEDDARWTMDLGELYVIQPSFSFWDRHRTTDGDAVDEAFRYASDTNTEWLTGKALLDLLADK